MQPVELKAVDSSMFSHVGYSEDMWILTVIYKSSGLRLDYQNLPPELYDEMMASESIGRFFNKSIKGRFKALGEEVAQQAGDAPLSVIDEDIRLVEKGWNGREIISQPEEKPDPLIDRVDVYSAHPDGTHTKIEGGVDVGQPAPKMMHISEVGEWPKDGILELPEDTPSIANFSSGLAKQTEGEVLAKWSAPESPAEALDMLIEHKGEIQAIISANVATLADALTVKVTSQDSRLQASELLTRLTSKKEQTVTLLDPFRAVLYAAYNEAGAKVKAGVDPLESGIRHIKAQCLAWDQAQERERQRLIREQNEQREAEARRLQAEQSAQLTLAEVNDALEAGDTQRAEELIQTPIEVPRPYVPPTILPPSAPKVAGQSTTTTWKVDREAVAGDDTGQAYVNSITEMLRAVKDGKYPIDQAAALLLWDFSAADKLAGALMSAFAVPGLSAIPVGTMRVGKGKRGKKA